MGGLAPFPWAFLQLVRHAAICARSIRSYVSTVDSGNLAGHLIALANACREWTVLTPTAAQRLAGIADALDLAREATDLLRDGRRTQTVTWQQLDDALTALAAGVRRAGRWTARASRNAWRSSPRRPRPWPTSPPHSPSERGDDTGADMLFWIAGGAPLDRQPSA